MKNPVEIISTMFVEDVEGWNYTIILGMLNGERFLMHVSMQVDDRDMDVEMIAGPDMTPESEDHENWDFVLLAMSGRHGW